MSRPLDEGIEQRVTMIIDRARRSGASVPVRLNDARLLFTKDREHAVHLEALKDLMVEFRGWQPHEFLRLVNRELVNCTPADMYRAINKWLDTYVAHVGQR